MFIGIGFVIAVLIGVGFAHWLARRGQPHEEPLVWSLPDIARMQGGLMSGMAGVSITGLVLILTFASRGQAAPGSVGLDTVALMFGTAFGFFLQTFHALSFLPDRAIVGERVFRFYYGLTANLQLRTAALLIFGQSTLVEFYGLEKAFAVITLLTPGGIAAVFVVVAMVADQMGLVKFGEGMLTALAGLALGVLFYAAMALAGAHEPDAALVMTVLFNVINASSFAAVGMVLLSPRRPWLRAVVERRARLFAMVDMQLTIVAIVFLWLAVVRAV